MDNKQRIDKLAAEHTLDRAELATLIATCDEDERAYAAERARKVAQGVFGSTVYFRGIIEFSNHCGNDCLYCGIRRSNREVERYRLSLDEILACAAGGYELGFRTFVLQDGEDPYFNDERMCEIIAALTERYDDVAVTLSLGERSRESYQRLFDAGAARYLLRHETANPEHYASLHPAGMTLESRMSCLHDLRDIGFQVGCGMMVGTPRQTPEDLADDLLFMIDFQPHMVGMGPFIPHHATPLANEPQGSVELQLLLISLVRLAMPKVLLPATTALGTADSTGREKGILAGANVIMPNLSPERVRDNYLLYDGKIYTGDEALACNGELSERLASIGYEVVVSRGDHPDVARDVAGQQTRRN